LGDAGVVGSGEGMPGGAGEEHGEKLKS
jgi:hypothetical protein